MSEAAFPDGIADDHRKVGLGGSLSIFRALLLGSILVLAGIGLFGGLPVQSRSVAGQGATMVVTAPERLRNGMFFEAQVDVRAEQAIGDAVIVLPAALWRDVTINSLIPAAEKEVQSEGDLRYHFGPLRAGDTLRFKVDGQVNPARFGSTGGRLLLLDGEREIAATALRLQVIG